ncbi:hypothetical protein HYV81_05840 [Candidatus Woesearchaeota archaeon]|nr:hypothetical protein [Candidatus Woesearchaeota archaeon]
MSLDNLEFLKETVIFGLKVSCPIYGAFVLRNKLEDTILNDWDYSPAKAAAIATVGAGAFELAKLGMVTVAIIYRMYY